MNVQVCVLGSKTTFPNTKRNAFCFPRCRHTEDWRSSRFREEIFEFIFECVDFEMFVGSSSEDTLTFD